MWDAEAGAALERGLTQINSMRTATWADDAARCQVLIDALNALLDFPDTRLAAYGTLAPGESNHAMLAGVQGTWVDGTVQGVRFMANGYPAFEPRPGSGRVPVRVLTSAALPEHWARLDEFEGADYRRILVPVRLEGGTLLVANLYEYIAPRAGIYHVTAAADWSEAQRAGVYRLSTRGQSLDEVGFIHCSYADQVTRVANAIYRGVHGLMVLVVDPARLASPVRDEAPADSDEKFPHIYGPLNIDAVVEVVAFEPSADGTFQMPSASDPL